MVYNCVCISSDTNTADAWDFLKQHLFPFRKNIQHMKKSFEKRFQGDEHHQNMLQSVRATPNVHLRSSKILLMLLGNTLQPVDHSSEIKTLVSPWFSTKIPKSGPLGSHFNKWLPGAWCSPNMSRPGACSPVHRSQKRSIDMSHVPCLRIRL